MVAEGELRPDGVFRVNALGQPPPERRADSLRALQVGRAAGRVKLLLGCSLLSSPFLCSLSAGANQRGWDASGHC